MTKVFDIEIRVHKIVIIRDAKYEILTLTTSLSLVTHREHLQEDVVAFVP